MASLAGAGAWDSTPKTLEPTRRTTVPRRNSESERAWAGGTVEGYPEDAGSVPAGFLFNGALSTYEKLGFTLTARSASTAGSWPGSSSPGHRRRGQTLASDRQAVPAACLIRR